MRNIKLVIEYDGSNFSGWQIQPNDRTVQREIEKALKLVTKEEVKLIGSGRTDSGVHARGQVANFLTSSKIPGDRFKYALNSILSKDISIVESLEVPKEFHSRYDALSKKYRYIIYNSNRRSALLRNYSYYVPYELDFNLMEKSIKKFEGEHDFVGFMSTNSNIKNTVRKIESIDIKKNKDMIYIDVVGNGFLYNMVRIIVGTMVDIGRGNIKNDISYILESKNRDLAGHTAPAQGLYLEWVKYSSKSIDN